MLLSERLNRVGLCIMLEKVTSYNRVRQPHNYGTGTHSYSMRVVTQNFVVKKVYKSGKSIIHILHSTFRVGLRHIHILHIQSIHMFILSNTINKYTLHAFTRARARECIVL